MTPHRLPTAAAIAAPVVAGVTARTAAASKLPTVRPTCVSPPVAGWGNVAPFRVEQQPSAHLLRPRPDTGGLWVSSQNFEAAPVADER